jgi:hypothetical protein
MRLIDGDALGRYLNDWRYSISLNVKYAREYAILGEIMETVEHAPTVYAVSVVYCKDCKFNPKHSFCGCPMAGISTRTDNDFCSKGERE